MTLTHNSSSFEPKMASICLGGLLCFPRAASLTGATFTYHKSVFTEHSPDVLSPSSFAVSMANYYLLLPKKQHIYQRSAFCKLIQHWQLYKGLEITWKPWRWKSIQLLLKPNVFFTKWERKGKSSTYWQRSILILFSSAAKSYFCYWCDTTFVPVGLFLFVYYKNSISTTITMSEVKHFFISMLSVLCSLQLDIGSDYEEWILLWLGILILLFPALVWTERSKMRSTSSIPLLTGVTGSK